MTESTRSNLQAVTAGGKVVVVGQGYVGLPVAMRALQVGFNVLGVDSNESRVEALRRGQSYIEDVSNRQLSDAVESGRYVPTAEYSQAEGFDYAIITVPTPLKDSMPDLRYIEESAVRLGEFVSVGSTVILESTTYPGTTEEIVVPLLERYSGKTAGQDFYVGYSPERIDPGNSEWNFVNTPKVVSGINNISLEQVTSLYARLVHQTVPVASPREAELAKLLENTFRHVNIALVNELAIFARQLGVDVWQAIKAASTKPFGFMPFTPGPGVGGHCLPVDPSYLSWQVRKTLGRSFRFVELANDVNEHMPNYVVQRLVELLNDQAKAVRTSRILVAGLAYKKNTADAREAPALRIIEILRALGAEVLAADPFVAGHQWPEGIPQIQFDADQIRESDVVLLVTDHDAFDLTLLEDCGTAVLDTRNVVSGKTVEVL